MTDLNTLNRRLKSIGLYIELYEPCDLELNPVTDTRVIAMSRELQGSVAVDSSSNSKPDFYSVIVQVAPDEDCDSKPYFEIEEVPPCQLDTALRIVNDHLLRGEEKPPSFFKCRADLETSEYWSEGLDVPVFDKIEVLLTPIEISQLEFLTRVSKDTAGITWIVTDVDPCLKFISHDEPVPDEDIDHSDLSRLMYFTELKVNGEGQVSIKWHPKHSDGEARIHRIQITDFKSC